MDFQWDEQKERLNIKKHGIHFDTAAHIFLDRLRIERPDIYSESEERWQTIGFFEDVLLWFTLSGETKPA
jgi:uncharacterized DUF497 family protein